MLYIVHPPPTILTVCRIWHTQRASKNFKLTESSSWSNSLYSLSSFCLPRKIQSVLLEFMGVYRILSRDFTAVLSFWVYTTIQSVQILDKNKGSQDVCLHYSVNRNWNLRDHLPHFSNVSKTTNLSLSPDYLRPELNSLF